MYVLEGIDIVKKILLSGIKEKQINPVSVELHVERIEVIKETLPLIEFEKTFTPKYEELITYKKDGKEYYYLSPYRSYLVTLAPRVKMLSNCFGILLPRSSLQRCGIIAQGTLVDPNYEGNLKVLLYPVIQVKIEKNARLFHLVVLCKENNFSKLYEGQWNRET